MNRLIKVLPIAVVAALVLTSCGGYNKLLKSNDHQKMYTKAIEYYNLKKYQKTLQLFEVCTPYFVNTAKEDTVQYYVGASYYKTGDFETSATYFDDFRRRFGRSPFLEDAEYMLAKGFYFSSPDAEKDQTSTQKALIAINEYLDRYPNSTKKEALQANLIELQQKLYDKSLINARSYYKTEKYKSAIVALKNAEDEYPNTPHREEIMYLITKSGYIFASNSIESLKRDRYLDMVDYYLNFISEFPESKYIKELDKLYETAKEQLAKYEQIEL